MKKTTMVVFVLLFLMLSSYIFPHRTEVKKIESKKVSSIEVKKKPAKKVKNKVNVNEFYEFIKTVEGVEYEAYVDICGHYTIGAGHKIKETESHLLTATLSEKEVLSLLKKDLKIHSKTVNESIKVNISQKKFNALMAFSYNLGINAFKSSTLVKKINAGASDKEIEIEFMKWNKGKVKGKIVEIEGLNVRREKECDLFFS